MPQNVLMEQSFYLFHFTQILLLFYAWLRSLESFLPQAFVTQRACIIPPTHSPNIRSNMLINVSHPHPLSMQTANGGRRKHNKIEQQRFTIVAVNMDRTILGITDYLKKYIFGDDSNVYPISSTLNHNIRHF